MAVKSKQELLQKSLKGFFVIEEFHNSQIICLFFLLVLI